MVLYFGDENGTLHALNSDGTVKWTYEVEEVADTNRSILSSPHSIIPATSILEVVTDIATVCTMTRPMLPSTGNMKPETGWIPHQYLESMMKSYLYLVMDICYSLPTFSATTENLPNWEVFTGDVFYCSPVVDENGRIYVIGYTGGGKITYLLLMPTAPKHGIAMSVPHPLKSDLWWTPLCS